MRFEKWQALGNDYLIVEADELPWELTAARVRRLCDPHFGLGSDGVLLLSRSEDPELVAELRIFNPDGSEAELSGNGAREAILYLRRHGWTDADDFSIGTAAGPITPTITSERTCSVEMGRASRPPRTFPPAGPTAAGTLEAGGREWGFQHVSIGNPQCAIEVGDELERARPGGDRARDRRPASCSRTAPTSPSCGSTAAECGRGSSSAGWGRRSPRGPAPAAPRSPPSWAAPRARSRRARRRRARGRDLRPSSTCG